MIFNTWLFFFFFVVVFSLYLVLRRRPAQNWLLLVASCFFYGWWDWRFLFLVGFSTVIDFTMALKMDATDEVRLRRRYLAVSVISNLTLLGFFKYFNFFADSTHKMLASFGVDAANWRLGIILPVGISFYTFHALSYVIDVYRRDLRATYHFRDFSLFVMFFPQLVAGPIGRASHQLPQFLRERHITIDGLRDGMWLIFWGLFKKVCIADNLARFVDQNFARSAELNAPLAYLTVLAFAYQIYCDFSGYTDMARGLAKMMCHRRQKSCRPSGGRTRPRIRRTSGGDGTSASRAGCVTICTSRSAEAAAAPGSPTATCSSRWSSAGCGMARRGTSSGGASITACCSSHSMRGRCGASSTAAGSSCRVLSRPW